MAGRVRARNTRFEDGKFSSESFEGELEGDAYDRMVQQTQQYIADQTAQILRIVLVVPARFEQALRDRD